MIALLSVYIQGGNGLHNHCSTIVHFMELSASEPIQTMSTM